MYKVLLVDDEARIREAISENTRWKELGYELMGTCKNGREAIERLDQEEADLVLTDICMPYVDGMELTRYLYEKHKGCLLYTSGMEKAHNRADLSYRRIRRYLV